MTWTNPRTWKRKEKLILPDVLTVGAGGAAGASGAGGGGIVIVELLY